MTEQQLEEKRDGIDLLAGLSQDGTRQAIVRSFERLLSEYVEALLSADMDDAAALHTRAKALGIVEALTAMGVKISHIADYLPIRRATEKVARQAMNL